MTTITAYLSTHPFFSCLGQSEISELGRMAIARRYQAGEYLSRYGDIWPYLFLVTEGAVSAVKESSEGRSLMVATFETGDLFWGVAFFHEDLPMPVTLETRDAASVYLWSRQQMLPFLSAHGCFSWELCRLMVSRMLRASEILEELAFHPVAGRLARFLLDQSAGAEGDRLARNLTLDEMAARVGTTREMVCRMLYRFAEQGAIRINRTEFIFTDRSVLEEHTRRG
jgi:CRP-like cAMP-binding protein